jgi:hypothetical protein
VSILAGVKAFRSFVVSCQDADAADQYRFEITRVSRDAVTMRERIASGGLPEVIDFTFAAHAFDDASGLLAIAQTNDVTHEDDPRHRSSDGGHVRTIRLVDTTPPFVLSRRLARVSAASGRIDGLRFFDFLGTMDPLELSGEVDREITIRGESKRLRAQRYRSGEGDELLLVRKLPPFGDANLVLGCARSDGTFAVTLDSID